jgi:hypothetical protein
MSNAEHENEPGRATRARIAEGMAQPRVAKSAEVVESPSVTMPGTVEKIIPAAGDHRPEKVQIAVEGPDDLYREIRIENALQNEAGEDVRLKLGAKVEVTIAAIPSTVKE